MLHEQVELGNITKIEKEYLLQQNADRLASLIKDGKSTEKALRRKKLLESIEPVPIPKLKHHLLKPLTLIVDGEDRGLIMGIGEEYKGRCQNCGADYCSSCARADHVCQTCAQSSLFQARLVPSLG